MYLSPVNSDIATLSAYHTIQAHGVESTVREVARLVDSLNRDTDSHMAVANDQRSAISMSRVLLSEASGMVQRLRMSSLSMV